MAYQIGETIVCSCVVTNSAGTQVDPDTSMKITIYDSYGVAVVDSQDMTKDDTGEYHYDYTPASDARVDEGDDHHIVHFVATDGDRVTIGKETFVLEKR
jgi:hypothetical protein